MTISTHPETFLHASNLGTSVFPYRYTYPLEVFLNAHHAHLDLTPDNKLVVLTAPGLLDDNTGEVIPGWLWKGDALKLYEMAFFASGDVLELGTFAGLSTCIMAQAMADSGRVGELLTVDIADAGWKKHAEATRVAGKIVFHLGPATEAVQQFIRSGRKFGFVFVDHSHTYEDVAAVCPLLDQVLQPGSFVQFHDYNDPRNGVEPDYGVWQAVLKTLPATFQFCGTYGCSGLYRYTPAVS